MSRGGVGGLTTDDLVPVLAPRAGSLQSLRLGELSVTPPLLATLLPATLTRLALTDLDLSWCEELDAAALTGLLSRCPDLTQLALQCCSLDNDAVQALAGFCPSLRALNLNRCRLLKLGGPSLLALGGSPAAACLTFLDLSWCHPPAPELHVLLERCTSLRHLALQGCKELGPEALWEVPPSPHLRFLDLSWCDHYSREVARALSCRRQRVVVLDYYGDVALAGVYEGDMGDPETRSRILAPP